MNRANEAGNSIFRHRTGRYFMVVLGFAGISFLASVFLTSPIMWIFSGVTFFSALGFWRYLAQSSDQDSNAVQSPEAPHAVEGVQDHFAVLGALYEHNPSGVAVLDAQGCIVRLNASGEQMMGYREEEMKGRSITEYITPDRIKSSAALYAEVLKGTPKSFKSAVIHKDGYRVDLHTTAAPIKNGAEVKGIVVICTDITANRRSEEQIRHMAYYDDMTGLPNRRLFVQQMESAMASFDINRNRAAVFFIDIDRFKMVNDGFGHDYGDMLLLQVAERFTRCLSENDFMARTEGDGFALFFNGLAPGNEIEQVTFIAESLIGVLEEPFILEQYRLNITASIGIALVSEDEKSVDELMKGADMALTRAKQKGRNSYQLFNNQMKSISLEKLTMEQELRRAIAGDELLLYYQPQMDIASGRIVGFEALVRWAHPERGIVSPGHFIPFAEESGLIVPLGEWVLREACRQNKRWQEQGYEPPPVSVNLSMQQFLQHNLTGKVAEVLELTGLDAAQLELEITESSTMDVEYAIEQLYELKSLGVKISIDDFGTGYSSLSYLKKFPIDKLKIDQSFVREIMTDPNDAAIVASIIAMTGHMKLKVIAEGVETEEQLQFLHRNHCDEIQGYYFSPPLNVEAAERLMKERRKATTAAGDRMPS